MKLSVKSVIGTALGIGLLALTAGCGSNLSTPGKAGKPAVTAKAKHSKATQVKLGRMGELCEHSIAIKRLAKTGTTRDVGWRATKMQGLASKLKYGSVAFYAGQVKDAAASGKKSGVKTLTGAASAALKLDKSKKYGKCSCKTSFKCKMKKKKKKK